MSKIISRVWKALSHVYFWAFSLPFSGLWSRLLSLWQVLLSQVCQVSFYFAAGPFMHVFPLPVDMFKGGVPVSMSLSLFQPTNAKTVSKSRFVDKISKLYLNLFKCFCILVSLSKQKTWRIVGCFYAALNTTLSR